MIGDIGALVRSFNDMVAFRCVREIIKISEIDPRRTDEESVYKLELNSFVFEERNYPAQKVSYLSYKATLIVINCSNG